MPSTVSTAKGLFLGDLVPKNMKEWSAGATATKLPAILERQIARCVATMWRVDPARIVLEWGWVRDVDRLDDETEFRLVGDGSDCWFAVVFEQEDRPAVATRMRAGLLNQVAHATRDLDADSILGKDDFTVSRQACWGPPSVSAPLVVEAGWLIKQTIASGDLICAPAACPAPIVQVGDTVRLTWRRGMVTVCLEGEALHAAAVGEGVEVRLLGRRGNAVGTVTGRGRARLAS